MQKFKIHRARLPLPPSFRRPCLHHARRHIRSGREKIRLLWIGPDAEHQRTRLLFRTPLPESCSPCSEKKVIRDKREENRTWLLRNHCYRPAHYYLKETFFGKCIVIAAFIEKETYFNFRRARTTSLTTTGSTTTWTVVTGWHQTAVQYWWSTEWTRTGWTATDSSTYSACTGTLWRYSSDTKTPKVKLKAASKKRQPSNIISFCETS